MMMRSSQFEEVIRQHIWGTGAGKHLRTKVLRGGMWLGGGSTAEQLCRFARNLILVRLLAPEAFGTMAIVLSSLAAVTSLSDVGIREAIIQNPRGHEAAYLNAAWWLGLGRGLGLYLLVFSIAPWMSRFYGSVDLTVLLRTAFLSVLFDSMLSQKAVLSIKTMTFYRWAAISHGGSICGVCITLTLAYFFRDTKALAVGYCTESAARCVLSYAICPSCPRLPIEKTAARDLLRFSKGLVGLSALNLLFAQTDIFVLGKLYSAADLGLYAMGISLVRAPASFLMNLLGQTLLPVYSQVQADKSRVNGVVHTITSLVLLVGLPALTCLGFCARSVLTVVYGHRYAAAVAPLLFASGVAVLNVLNGQLTMVFYAAGRPNLHRIAVAVMAGTMVAAIYPLTMWFGLSGGQVAALISVAIGLGIQLIRVHRMTGLDCRLSAPVLGYAICGSLAVAATCLAAKLLPLASQPIPTIVSGIGGCIVALYLYYLILFHGGRRATLGAL